MILSSAKNIDLYILNSYFNYYSSGYSSPIEGIILRLLGSLVSRYFCNLSKFGEPMISKLYSETAIRSQKMI